MATIEKYETSDGPSYKISWDLPRSMVPAGQKRAKGSLTLYDPEQADEAARIALVMRHAVTGDQVVKLIQEIFYPDAAETTFRAWSEQWLKSMNRRWSEKHQHDNRTKMMDVILPALGQIPLKELTGPVIDKFLWELKEERGIKFRTCDLYYGLISQSLKYAHLSGEITFNPVVKCLWVKGAVEDDDWEAEREAEKYFTPDELKVLIKNVRPDYRRFIEFMVHTGLRFGEVTALRVGDVHWDVEKIHVVRAVKPFFHGGGGKVGSTKNKKRRWVELTKRAFAILKIQCAGKKDEDLVFTGSRGGMIRNTNFRRDHWNPAMIKSRQCPDHLPMRADGRNGLLVLDKTKPSLCSCLGSLRWTAFTPHALRHTYATWAIAGGADLKKLSEQLGHSSLAVTEKVYIHQISRMRTDNVAFALEAAFAGLDPESELAVENV